MPRDFKVYLDDILQAIEKIRLFSQGLSARELEADAKTLDAVIRNLEIIGEAVKHLSGDLRSQYPQVPWQDIAGARDKLIHDYFGVDIEQVWIMAREDIPLLKKEITKIMDEI